MNQTALFDTRHGAASGRTTYTPAESRPIVPPKARGAVDTRSHNHRQHREPKRRSAASAQRTAYLRVLYAAGPEGMTDQEAAREMGINPSTVSARRNEATGAQSAEYALRPLVCRILDPKSRTCRVTGRTVAAWTLTEAGREEVRR